MPREYSEAEKTHWVAKVASDGLAAAWRESGIPKPTIARWAHKAGVETYQPEKTHAATEALKAMHAQRRETLKVQLLERALDLLERMDAEHVDFKGKDADTVVYPIAPAAAVQNYAMSAAILIDKFRLEMGEATGRTETRTLTSELDEDAKARLRHILFEASVADDAPEGEAGDLIGDRAEEVRQ